MRVSHLIALLIVVVAASAILACSDDEEASPPDDQTEAPETIEVEMTLEDFSYAPASINADLGDEVFVELANDGDEEHTFTINEFFVDETLASGEDRDVTFTPDEPGEFTFFCRNHDNMQGSIRIARPGEAAQPTDEAEETDAPDNDPGGIGY
jgi:plastocyanin